MSASFDFVECAAKSYLFIWEKRRDILRLSAMALVVKVLFFVGFVVFDLQQNLLRQGLFLLPSYMLEGWVVAHLMIMALHHDDLKEGRKQSLLPAPESLDRYIKASMIMYVLIKLALSFVGGMTFNSMKTLPEGPPPDPSLQTFLAPVFLIGFLIWGFRFLWLYVPVVMGRGPVEFLRSFKSFASSFYFLGVWGMCFVPLLLLLLALSEAFGALITGLGLDAQSVIFESGLAALQACIDYFMVLTSSIAVAYGVYSAFRGENKKTAIW